MVTTLESIRSIPIAPSDPAGSASGPAGPRPSGVGFGEELTAAASGHSVQISGHAARRIEQRGISLDGNQLDRLTKAFDQLAARGGRSSLVWLDQVGYIVHVPSHTVVTAVRPDERKEAVFTQIDSVAIA